MAKPEVLEMARKKPDEERATIRDFISGLEVEATPEEVEAVQVFARRLVEDYGYDKSQIQTHPQFSIRRSPSDEARSVPLDIGAFHTDEKVEDNLRIIVECKRKTKREGVQQLKRYLEMSPASVGVWFNGNEHAYLWKVFEKGKPRYVDIPNIPRKDQRVEDIGKFKRKDLKAPQNLKAVFRDIRNHLAGLTTGITRDEALAQEIMNLLFCKIYDEMNTGPEETVEFRCGVHEDKGDVRRRIVDLFENKVKREFSDVFSAADEITLDTASLVYVAGELQNYCITEAERDALGEAFEVFIGPSLKGPEGQFFTPRNVVRLAVEILDPDPGDMIIDPACGSGGFLIAGLDHVWRKIRDGGEKRGLGEEWIRDEQQKIANRSFRGIDKDSFLAKVTKAYMAIVRDGRGGIFCENSLLPASEWSADCRRKISLHQFDFLMTNPPFGAKIAIHGESILRQFSNLGFKWRRDKRTGTWSKTSKLQEQLPPQILFIERCLQLVREGGRIAIVLPDGVLGGAKLGYIAHYIKETSRLIALVDLPVETFAPMVTTKTHLVVLERKENGRDDGSYPIFMAVAQRVGHDRKGRAIFSEAGTVCDDIPVIISEFRRLFASGETKKDFSHLGYIVESRWLEDSLIAKRYLPEFMDALERIEKVPYPKRTLEAIRDKLYSGANVGVTDYTDSKSGVPYILVRNITEEGINCADMKYVKPDSVRKAKNAVVRAGDIVINRTGNPGIAAVVPDDLDRAVACGFVFRLSVKEGYDPHYVAAFLNSELGSKQTRRLALGSVLDHITKSDLETVRVILPPDDVITEIARKVRDATRKRADSRKLLNEAQISLLESYP